MEAKFQNNLEILLQQLENFLTTKTVVGEPIHIDNTILVPLVDISFGVGAGGSVSNVKNKAKDKEKTADGMTDVGGGGLGANITPSAVLVIQNGTTQLISIKKQDSISKLIDMVPGLISKVSAEFKPKDKKDKETIKKDIPKGASKETPKEATQEEIEKVEEVIKEKIEDSYHNLEMDNKEE